MTDQERAELNHYRHWLRNDPGGHSAFKRWTLMQAQGDAYCMRCGGSGWDGAVTCQDCKGCGRVHTKPGRPAAPQLCPRCVGGIAKVEGGHIVCIHCMGSGLSDGMRTCQACSGKRVVKVDGLNKLCPICSGHGRLPKDPSPSRINQPNSYHQAMTDRELDAWVAEHVMGLDYVDLSDPIYLGDPKWIFNQLCIHYTTDLNACAQAEAKLAEMAGGNFAKNTICVEYDWALLAIIRDAQEYRHGHETSKARFLMVTATARQRCEAMYAIREDIEKARLKEK